MPGSTPAVSLKIRRFLKRESRFLRLGVLERSSGRSTSPNPRAAELVLAPVPDSLSEGDVSPTPTRTVKWACMQLRSQWPQFDSWWPGRLDSARCAGQAGLGLTVNSQHTVNIQSTYSQHTVNIQSTHSQHNSQHVLLYQIFLKEMHTCG